jgi:hypothetical protein
MNYYEVKGFGGETRLYLVNSFKAVLVEIFKGYGFRLEIRIKLVLTQ